MSGEDDWVFMIFVFLFSVFFSPIITSIVEWVFRLRRGLSLAVEKKGGFF